MYKKLEINENEPALNVLLKLTANASIADAEKARVTEHAPKFHESGWKIAIETPRGVVGLWSCWLENQFYLGYPGPSRLVSNHMSDVSDAHGISVADNAITKHLGVNGAHPVLQVNATAVEPGYEGEYKDPDKPLEVSAVGQTLAYQTVGWRVWAKYVAPRIESKVGRVWVEHSDFCSNSHEFSLVRVLSGEGSETVWYGHHRGWGIYTHPFTHANKYAPDGPTAERERIQPYRDKFLALACDIADMLGGALAVNIDYGYTIVPEQLEQLGYENPYTEWLKGSPGNYKGWGQDLVISSKPAERTPGAEYILLKSANEMVPWSTIRRIPTVGVLQPSQLLELLTF